MKNRIRVGTLIFLLLFLVACTVQEMAQPAGETPAAAVRPTEPAVTATAPGTAEVTGAEEISEIQTTAATLAGEEPALIWQAEIETEEGPQKVCRQLLLGPDEQALLGPCGAADTTVSLLPHQAKEWADILARFAPFQADTLQGTVVFRGRGDVAGPAWERAIAAWARFTYQELQAGRVGAALKTEMSWRLGELPDQPGYCKHLVVLTFGYAYANVDPCQGGGQPLSHSEGWLKSGAWEQFDTWLYQYGPVYQADNYFSGKGSQEMPEAEIDQLETWAEAIYAGLAGS
jgi:hypothetical protein